MKIKRLVLEVAMPEDQNEGTVVNALLKNIRKEMGKKKKFKDFSYDLISPLKIMWMEDDNKIVGDMPPQLLMMMCKSEGSKKLPIGFQEDFDVAAKKKEEEGAEK